MFLAPKIWCQAFDHQRLLVFFAPKSDTILLFFLFFELWPRKKKLLVVQSLVLNIVGPRKFQFLVLQGLTLIDDGAPIMELPWKCLHTWTLFFLLSMSLWVTIFIPILIWICVSCYSLLMPIHWIAKKRR